MEYMYIKVFLYVLFQVHYTSPNQVKCDPQKQIRGKQSAKKRRNKCSNFDSKDFQKTLQSDMNTLQTLYNADKDSVFSYGGQILDKIMEASGGSTKRKLAWEGQVYYYFLKACYANGDHNEALRLSASLFRLADTIEDKQLLYNCYNMTAKIYVQLEDYRNAATLWEEMIRRTTDATERAYVLHEIGRCYYSLSQVFIRTALVPYIRKL